MTHYASHSALEANHVEYLQHVRRADSDSMLCWHALWSHVSTIGDSPAACVPRAVATSWPVHQAQAQQNSIAAMLSSRAEQNKSL